MEGLFLRVPRIFDMNISIPIPFSEDKIHFGTVWATLRSTDENTGLNSARVGALALRVANGDTVHGASAFALGKAMDDSSDAIDAAASAADDSELILANQKIARLQEEVTCRDNRIQQLQESPAPSDNADVERLRKEIANLKCALGEDPEPGLEPVPVAD